MAKGGETFYHRHKSQSPAVVKSYKSYMFLKVYTLHSFPSLLAFLKMLSYLLQVLCDNYINDENHSLTFYIELSSKFVGVGLNLALLKEN